MSKFVELLTTFKNGLISPRLRGSLAQPTDRSSAETLDNFIVDRVGAAVKRPGTLFSGMHTYSANGFTYYKVNLLGTDYIIKFNPSNKFNSVDGSYNSTFCEISSNGGFSFAETVKVFSKGYVTSATDVGDMALWNGRHATDGVYLTTGVSEYLDTYVIPTQYRKISDRTVVFTTGSFSFYLSILDHASASTITRRFYLYPYFVSGILLAQTLGKNIPSAVKCPIVPSNFPFNPVNTDTTLTVTCAEYTSGANPQTGSLPTDGVISKSNERLSWAITLPKSVGYVNGVATSLVGKFISVPNAATTKDVVFFLTKIDSEVGASVTYIAIQVTGGVALASTHLWKLSTWGGDSHPRAVSYCFGRLMYGNTSVEPSRWWASATHPDNPLYFQGFMQQNLLQDATSDVSGINYAGKSGGGSSDIYRWGFTNTVPSGGAIGWIASRRRIHFGTSLGECQLSVYNGVYSAASYEQLQTGTDKSDLQQIAEGNRKIFYIANNGKDIRSISTEDKDYESVDKLLTVPLAGLFYTFSKIVWSERFSCLFALTSNKRLFAIAIHADTDVRAISEVKTVKQLKDIVGDSLVVKGVDYSGPTDKYFLLEMLETVYGVAMPNIDDCDVYLTLPPLDLSRFGNQQIYMWFKNVLYTIPDASAITLLSQLPFNYLEVTDAYPLYVFKDKISCKLKTVFVHGGANFGSAVGNIHRVDRVSILVDSSGQFKYGTEESNLIDSENVGPSTTAVVNVDMPASPEVEQFIHIQSDAPTPLNISGISLRGVSYSGE